MGIPPNDIITAVFCRMAIAPTYISLPFRGCQDLFGRLGGNYQVHALFCYLAPFIAGEPLFTVACARW